MSYVLIVVVKDPGTSRLRQVAMQRFDTHASAVAAGKFISDFDTANYPDVRVAVYPAHGDRGFIGDYLAKRRHRV